MSIPFTTIQVSLPEELGFIENVKAVVLVNNKEILIDCEHYTRFHSSDGSEWLKIFNEEMNLVTGFKIEKNDSINTSVFRGTYFLYDESYLEGEFYFIFDFYKDFVKYENYKTSTGYFKLELDDYYDYLELFKE